MQCKSHTCHKGKRCNVEYKVDISKNKQITKYCTCRTCCCKNCQKEIECGCRMCDCERCKTLLGWDKCSKTFGWASFIFGIFIITLQAFIGGFKLYGNQWGWAVPIFCILGFVC